RPRTWFAWLGTLCLSRGYRGLRPLAPYLPVSGASVSEANRGRRWAKPSDNGMTTHDTRKPVKDSTRLRHAPKRFSLWSLRGFFLTRQKEISQNWVAGTASPCSARGRCPPAGKYQRPSAAAAWSHFEVDAGIAL